MGQTAELKFEPKAGTPPVAESFLACLENADHKTSPFDYWLLTNPLPKGNCEAIASLPFAPPQDSIFNGKRETNNSTRVYFTPENQAKHAVCRRVAEGFKDKNVRRAIEKETGTDLSGTRLRVEYCQDTDGFWLEPHTDIFIKKFTMLVYLSDDINLATAGTDIHEGPPDFKYTGSAPYGRNLGVIFIPGKNSWHGVGHNSFKGVRKSIIINYVTPDWRDTWELA
jgi:hypothetical protein